LSFNRIAADDNPVKLMSIALNPLANPPFPLETIDLSKVENSLKIDQGADHE
jgi:hypothetical protein